MFLGRQIRTTTVFHRDPDGRVFKTESIADPDFLPDDIEAMLEWQREQALLCSGCGLPRDETMAREAQDAYRTKALRCHACAARERAEGRMAELKGTEGMYFTVERPISNGSLS